MHPLDGPLHMALYHGHADAVRLLLEHGAIWIAKCVIRDTDMVDLLISRGATYH